MTQPGQKSEIVLCLLPLIENGRAGFHADAAAADVIAACARFNLWFLEEKRAPRVDDDNFLRMLDVYDEAARECQAAVQSFHHGGERRDLVEALRQVVEKLNQRPESTLSPARISRRPLASEFRMTQSVPGIIGGSRLYDIPALQNVRWERSNRPGASHRTGCLFTDLERLPVRFLPRHGRGHTSPQRHRFARQYRRLKRAGAAPTSSRSRPSAR